MGVISTLTTGHAAPMGASAFSAAANAASYTGRSPFSTIPARVSGTTPFPSAVYHPPQNPNYTKILGGDSIFTSGLAGLGVDQQGHLTGTGQAAALGTDRSAARRAALEAFGGVPDFSASQSALAGFSPHDIDATTRTLAAQNQNSVLATLGRNLASAQSGTVSGLAGRGMLHSGALAARENYNVSGYNTSLYNAVQNLLSNQLLPAQTNYLSGLSNIQTQRGDLVSQAMDRLNTLIGAGVYGPTPGRYTWPTAPAHARPDDRSGRLGI